MTYPKENCLFRWAKTAFLVNMNLDGMEVSLAILRHYHVCGKDDFVEDVLFCCIFTANEIDIWLGGRRLNGLNRVTAVTPILLSRLQP